MATGCTQESVLDFLLENGGRVKNKDLVEHFKVFLSSSDNTTRATSKERFKRFVDNIAYVKQEDGEKVVRLKKKHREMRSARAQEDDDGGGDLRGGIHALKIEETARKNESESTDETSEKMMVSEVLCTSRIALLTEKSDLMSDCDVSQVSHTNKRLSQENINEPEAAEAPHTSHIIIHQRRTSRGSQRISGLLTSDDAAYDADVMSADGTPRGSRKTFIELMMSTSPQVRRSLVRRTSQEHISARHCDIISSSVDEDCACVTLDPLEHQWMMCAADGDWDALRPLLGCEPALILKKDFVTGFTCLHWAAKQGKHELLAALVNFAKRHNVAINVNARSSAGYTPLHLAAMHNRIEVMKLLVGAYDVDVDVRDYSGRKAAQYLPATVTGDIRDIIGACGNSDVENASGAGRRWLPKVLPSNLNPLRLLNPPEDTAPDGQVRPRALYRKSSIGRIRLQRSRFKTQIVHSASFRENDERDDSLKSPVKTRPMSNLFG